MEKTIAAISTPSGAGGMGVIRISGENAIAIADEVFEAVSGKKLSQLSGYRAAFGKIIDNGNTIDQAVALVFRAPHSYTGEDVVELSCHGGMYITKRVLRAVLTHGAQTAQAGEFTKRAFLNGKLGLTEAESVMDLISAGGEQQARAALSMLGGSLRKKINTVRDGLLELAAHLAAWADYPEDEIPEIDDSQILDGLDKAQNELEQLLSSYDAGRMMREGIDTVIVGRPNVGKSTLMNLLSGCERSIVTDIPGTTRDIIEETVMIGDIPLRLSDTAGIRYTDDPVESIGVKRAKERLSQAQLVLAVFDASSPLTDEDREIISSLSPVNTIALINKSDLISVADTDDIRSRLDNVVMISARTGEGSRELEQAIARITGTDSFDPSQAVLANERQHSAALEALGLVKEARDALTAGITFDAVTVLIEASINELLELTGERATEAVVDKVFSNFCVGK